MPADEIGLYRVEQGDKRAFAHVGAANPREFIDARSTDDAAQAAGRGDRRPHRPHGRRVAATSTCRASCRSAPAATISGSDWIGIRMTEASVLKGIVRVPLFGGYAGPAAFLALLVLLLLPAVTWFREGR